MLLNRDVGLKFIRYSIVGCLSTIIYFLSVFILVEFFNHTPLFASAVSFVIMTYFSFMLNKKYTFNSSFSHKKLLRFLLVSLIGFTLNFIIMFTIVNILSFHYFIGEVATTLVIPIINFILNHKWTFN